jgi:HTH-type transcriptional regulator/antitoxin HigA
MVRRLHEGLGIPAESLIAEGAKSVTRDTSFAEVDWKAFPLAEIARRRWFGDLAQTARQLRENAEELLGGVLLASESACPGLVALRQSALACDPDAQPALRAWLARAWQLAYSPGKQVSPASEVNAALISEVARLSVLDDGPLIAQQMLAKMGVALVVEPQLPATRLDGAAMRCADGRAIVALTLRYDRLDHFWFTLCHELAHLALHLREGGDVAVLDDLEAEERDKVEHEADGLAAEAMIPTAMWQAFAARQHPTDAEIQAFARSVIVHPAVVAGRIRRETNDYTKYISLLGNRKVRSLFA